MISEAAVTLKVLSLLTVDQDSFISPSGLLKIGAIHLGSGVLWLQQEMARGPLAAAATPWQGLGTAGEAARGAEAVPAGTAVSRNRSAPAPGSSTAQHSLRAGNCQHLQNKLCVLKIHFWLFTFWVRPQNENWHSNDESTTSSIVTFWNSKQEFMAAIWLQKCSLKIFYRKN